MSNRASFPWLRFSLRRLLIAVAVIAVIFGVFSVAVGQTLIAWMVLVFLRGVLPTIALVGAVYTRGSWRAFSLGALVACIPIGAGQGVPYGIPSAVIVLGSQALYILVCGGIAVAARAWLVRQGIANDL
ncbi:MAG: hypothetical protein AB7G28_11120 [Pirellulales bacterium]